MKLTHYQKNKGAEAVSASTPWYSAALAASAPVAGLVVMVHDADAVTVVRRGLDGGDAQHGQSEGGGDQLVHGRPSNCESATQARLSSGVWLRNEELVIGGKLAEVGS